MTPTSELTSLRYMAPTCTLEVMGELSPLSQLAEKPILKRLRFEVQIRDRSGKAVVEVRGLRSHLLALSTTVQDYVQSYLNTSSASTDLPSSAATEGIRLQADSLTRQTLHLGNLAPVTGPQQVGLSTLQLADLADVLDQMYDAVAILPDNALPQPVAVRRRSSSHRTAWIGAAAAGLLAVVGVSTVLSGVLNQSQPTQTETASAPQFPQQAQNPAATPEQTPDSLPNGALIPGPESRSQPLPKPQPTQPNGSGSPSGNTPAPLGSGDTTRSGQTAPAAPNPAAPEIAQAPAPQPAPRTPEQSPAASSETAPSQSAAKQPPANPTNSVPPAALSAPAPQGGVASSDAASAGASNRTTAEIGPVRSLEALRTTLQEQWTPPTDLAAPITYVLVIDPTGILQMVIPQDDLSRQYRDRIPLAQSGTKILVPPALPQTLKLTLFPSGSVILEPLPANP